MTDLIPHARSAGVKNPRIKMFETPPTDLSMSARRWVKINSFNTGINPVSFQIDPQDDFLDLSESEFEVNIVLKKDTAGTVTNLLATDLMGIVNNFANSLFKQINVRLNSTLISPQTDTYHYKAFLETVLNYDRDDGETILVPAGWKNFLAIPDDGDGDEFDANKINPAHASFKALSDDYKNVIYLRNHFVGGKKVTLRFKPFLEVFNLSKLMVPGVQIQMELYFNDPSVWGMRWDGAATLILPEANVDVRFFLCQVKVNPSIYREIMADMKGTPTRPGKSAVYPIVRSQIRTYSHPTDDRHFECNNPFQGQVPNRLIVGMVKQSAFNGDIGDNPFTFKKFNLSSIKQTINGEEYPYERLELKHDGNDQDWRGYQRFLRATGCLCRGKGNMVREQDWGHDKHFSIFVFDNTANGCPDSPVLNPKKTGEVRVVIEFGANPGSNLTVLLYGEFENLMEINGAGVVTYDVYR